MKELDLMCLESVAAGGGSKSRPPAQREAPPVPPVPPVASAPAMTAGAGRMRGAGEESAGC